MTRPRRLALLLPNFGGGGAERVALRLAVDWLAAGHEVDLVLLRGEGELLALLPPQVHVVDLAASRIRSALLPLIRYFRSRRPDAIQISMWPLTVIGILAHRLAGSRARIVTSDHVVLTRHYLPGTLAHRLLRLTTRLFYPMADSIILVSRQAADDLAALSGLPRSRMDVVYNPVSPPPQGLAAAPAVEALWGGARHHVITVGTLKAQKNHALLIRAFARVAEQRDATLMIVGEGPLRAELEALAAREGIAGKVIFVGFTLDPWPYYRTAQVFALSSDYEGYPLVLVEAMRSGLAVVSTDCESGPREILDGGRFGRLVPVGDAERLAEAIVKALDSPCPPDLMRARAEELSGASTSERYLDLMIGGRERMQATQRV